MCLTSCIGSRNMRSSIIILAVLLATVCTGKQSNTLRKDFLKTKWKIMFSGTDVNHDGVLSMKDLEEARSKYVELKHSSNYAILDKYWNDCNVRGKTDEVTEAEFLAMYDKEFTTDKKEFRRHLLTCEETLFFDIIDTNKDKFISEEEMNIILKTYGYPNAVLNKEYFRSNGPVDKRIPARKLINLVVDYITSEDDSKEDKIKPDFITNGA